MQLRPSAPRLHASWLRSERYGVSLERVEPVFSGDLDTGSLLYECAHEVLSRLHRTLANEPVSLMVTDRDGLVLGRLCSDPGIERALDRVHLARGFSYAERDAGTNGLGLALADRTPSLVRATEHYCTTLHGYTCAAVPVLDPVRGELAGSINLTTWSDSSSELLLALAQAAAGNTSALMLARSTGRRSLPGPRGEVFRVQPATAEGDADPCPSRARRDAVRHARDAMSTGRALAVVGERGAGKQTLAQLARRQAARVSGCSPHGRPRPTRRRRGWPCGPPSCGRAPA